MRGLPNDFSLIGPPQRFLDEAWAKHPQRAEMDQRARERNPDGGRAWMPAYTHAEDGWVEYWQLPWPWGRPDGRDPIRIGAWPRERESRALADEQALVDELYLSA